MRKGSVLEQKRNLKTELHIIGLCSGDSKGPVPTMWKAAYTQCQYFFEVLLEIGAIPSGPS